MYHYGVLVSWHKATSTLRPNCRNKITRGGTASYIALPISISVKVEVIIYEIMASINCNTINMNTFIAKHARYLLFHS